MMIQNAIHKAINGAGREWSSLYITLAVSSLVIIQQKAFEFFQNLKKYLANEHNFYL